jgi:hypothetical protein
MPARGTGILDRSAIGSWAIDRDADVTAFGLG